MNTTIASPAPDEAAPQKISAAGLMALLDIDGAAPGPLVGGPAGGELLVDAGPRRAREAPPCPTALVLDKWSLRKGLELVETSEVIQAQLPKQDMPDGMSAKDKRKWQAAQKAETAQLAADVFAAAFEPSVTLAERTIVPHRRDFLGQLIDTPDYQSLHARTMLDFDAAELAAAAFAQSYVALLKERGGSEPQDPDGGPACGAGKGPGSGGSADVQALKAAAAALRQAKKEVEARDEIARALGTADPRKAAVLYKRFRANQGLRRIAEYAGRFRRVAMSRQRAKAMHGLDDVVSVTPGGDLSRLVPSELAALAIPALKLNALRRMAERQLLCREHHAMKPVARGPICIIVDESGSMAGDKVYTAKGLALALAWVARRQKRWCGLVAFAGATEGRWLALPPDKWDETALVDWLGGFFSGGTEMDVPLVELPTKIWPAMVTTGLVRGKTDIVLVTDCIVRAPAKTIEDFNAWRHREQARVTTLVIDSRAPGDIVRVSDECYCVKALDPASDEIGAVLSI